MTRAQRMLTSLAGAFTSLLAAGTTTGFAQGLPGSEAPTDAPASAPAIAPVPPEPTPAEEPPAPAPPPVEAAPEAEPPAPSPWTFGLFADAQYVLSTRKNNPVDGMGMLIPHPGHRAWERNNGFALSFIGLDVVYDAEKFALTTSLRYGSSVVPFYAASTSTPDLDGVAAAFQAYGTWKPATGLTVDVGRFNTIFGAEVAESWKNLNYTRGALYYAFQPFWHTGVRSSYQATPELKLTGMIVNGVNNSLDAGKERPSVGAQATYAKGKAAVILGYLGSADPDADLFDHFVDLVATYTTDHVSLVLNADVFTNKVGDETNKYFGASLGAGYTVSDQFRVSGRGEVLVSDAEDTNLYTGTATLDYRPLGDGHVVVRLDNRFESSNQQLFINRKDDATKSFFQAVLGVVVTTN